MAEASPWTAARFVLSAAEFDAVRDHLGLGAAPAAMRLPSPARTRAERMRIAGPAGLRERGLAGPAGADPVLARLLGLLIRPERQLEVRGWFGAPLRAVAAERDGDGVLAVHTSATITVAAAGSPAHAAVSALPPLAAGPGPSIVMPTAVLAGLLAEPPASGPADLRTAEPITSGDATAEPARSGDTERLTALLRGPAHRAQICAVRHDRWGSPSRLPGHVAVVDTPRGRYRLSRETGPHGGPEWATLAPAGEPALRSLLDGLFSPGRSAASADDPPR